MKIMNSLNDLQNWVDGCFQNSLSADQIARAAVAVDSIAFRQGIAFGQDWEPVLAGVTIDQLTEWAGHRTGFYETSEEVYQVDPDGTIHCMFSPDLVATGGRPVEVDELPEGAVWSDHQRQAALLCKAKVVEFMTTVMTSSPSLPAILLAEKAMDHFGFADGSDESATCYDLAFELKAR